MSDTKKGDDPSIIPETELDDVSAGVKIPDLFSGNAKLADSFLKIDHLSTTIVGKLGKDVLSTSFNTGKKLD